MPTCTVVSCNNSNRKTKGTNIKYFSFPKNEDLAKKWLDACCRQDKINIKNAVVCSIHFEDDCFESPLKHQLLKYCPTNYRNLKKDAVPTKNIHIEDDKSSIVLINPDLDTLQPPKKKTQLKPSKTITLPKKKNIFSPVSKDPTRDHEKIKKLEEIVSRLNAENKKRMEENKLLKSENFKLSHEVKTLEAKNENYKTVFQKIFKNIHTIEAQNNNKQELN